MRTRTLLYLLSTISLALVFTVSPARAYDLTGHWVGKWVCKGNDGGVFRGGNFTSGNANSTMVVTQVQGTFALAVDPGPNGFTYNGVAVPNGAKPDQKGEAVLLGCHLGTTLPVAPFDGEMVLAKVTTKLNAIKASFKGTSYFVDDTPEFGTCKYSYKRIDTVDPNLTACP